MAHPDLDTLDCLSPERLSALLATCPLPMAMLVAGADGQVVHATPRAGKLLGLPEGALPKVDQWRDQDGRPFPSPAGPFQRPLAGDPVEDQLAQYTRGSEQITLRYNASPVRDQDGRVAGALLAFSDETRRVRLAAEVAHSERALRTIYNSVSDAIFIHALDGRILSVNERMLAMYRVDCATAVGLSIVGDYSAPGNHFERLPEVWNAAISGAPQRFPWIARRPGDGSTFEVEVSLTRIDYAGEDAILAVVRDTTEQRAAERERERLLRLEQEARRQAEAAALRAQEESEKSQRLVAVVSHDLRQPLAVLSATTALLRQPSDPPRLSQHLDRLERSTARISSMVRDLLDLARSRSGGIPVHLRAADLAAMARSAVEEARAAHPDRQIELLAEQPVVLDCDAERLHQALANLLANALTYGAPERPVSLRVRTEGGFVALEVHNQGEPIPESAFESIFEPFHRLERAPPAAPRASAGLGLGLFIVREIARAHGGRVGVRSSRREGTTFSVELPAGSLAASPEVPAGP